MNTASGTNPNERSEIQMVLLSIAAVAAVGGMVFTYLSVAESSDKNEKNQNICRKYARNGMI